ncbi:MAG TPA: hypothetical protein VG942_16310 [Hyphomonadaceae bacterium]|nr:hypothetical protein [Hyphomonadaceae bacterium]
MAMLKSGVALLAFAALAACATAPDQAASAAKPAAAPAAPNVYAGKSVLDAAIDAAGGQAALAQVKELYWTGTATINAGGKTTTVEMMTVVHPQETWARSTSFTKEQGEKGARTIQVEGNQGWSVNRVVWDPLPDAQAKNEVGQFALYRMMLLAPLKKPGATVAEQPVGADGTHAIQVKLADGLGGGELEFDASAKLVRAGLVVADPKTGADTPEIVKFSGEMASNGVKWPKHITIEQNGAPFFDLELTSFEANTAEKPRPLEHTMGGGQEQRRPTSGN